MQVPFERTDFQNPPLHRRDLLADPNLQLSAWWQDALKARIDLPDAAYLATVDANNQPNARVVLLKGFDENGLVFYTNYQSPKACELAQNPHACLTLFWPALIRQVRIRGIVEKTSRAESESYFASRPIAAQISATVSQQSSVVKSRDELADAHQKLAQQYQQPLPCPKYWGGFRLKPFYFEFWQGRPDRLHDRFAYTLQGEKTWQIDRLAP